MLDGIVIRGTTPVHHFDLPYPQEIVNDIRLSYCQKGKAIITKTINDCNLEDNIITVELTQKDTLSLLPNKTVLVELRVQLADNSVVSNDQPIELRVIDTVNEEVFADV